MSRIFQAVRAGLLATALVLLSWSAFSTPSDAEASVTCEGAGHSCHVIRDNGTTGHYEEVPKY